MTQSLLLVRHAASTGQSAEAPLSPEGDVQARALVTVLQRLRPSDLFASPYLRAVATLAPFAATTGRTVRQIDNLRERSLGSHDLPDWKAHIARSFDDADHAPPGGESLNAVHARALTAIATIIAHTTGDLPAAATHGGWISTVLHRIDPGFGYDGWQGLSNPDLILLTLEQGHPIAYRRLPKE